MKKQKPQIDFTDLDEKPQIYFPETLEKPKIQHHSSSKVTWEITSF